MLEIARFNGGSREQFYEMSRPEAAEMIGLADDCIRRNIESVLGCEIVAAAETE
ncbi:hypothetical protein EFA46_013320 (plasmid) [Halarchaeum sp. CBA1220]|uniref:hypothetical protein n=1 Tax=Halarchaeum sp. CBA1220 TaxID=1853682 RepID=UPI001314F5D9|nr:hypothetical protein [Halarchaeum sp. CBA1220]QLC35246.1 hypothetical protein EFA46_013320 [Halarchaeum sp. CBA1220]